MEENKALATIDNKVIEDFIFSTGTILSPQHKKLFIALAVHNQLDPFKREIHAIPYKDKDGKVSLSVVTGYEVYLRRAERSGNLDGWKAWTEGEGEKLKAFVEIKRKDWSIPFRHEVIFKEYNLNRSLWLTKPATMIKKVAIAQGFRLAFPEELGGIPYTVDEIDTAPDAKIVEAEEAQVVEESPIKSNDQKPPDSQSFEDYQKRMSEIKNIYELKAWFEKHLPELKTLPPEQFKEIVAYKDHLKKQFAETK